MRSLLLAAWAFAAGMANAGEATAQDADNLDQAASMVRMSSRIVAAEMDECQRLHPDQVFKWRLANFIWQLENKIVVAEAERVYSEGERQSPLVGVADTVGNTALSGMLLAFAQIPAACENQFRALAFSKEDVKVKTPKAYAFLMSSRPKGSDVNALQERNDVTIGCMKGYANKGLHDFDKALTFCQCNTDLIYSELSSQDRKVMFAYKGSAADAIHTPWMQKIRPGAVKCASHLL